MMRQLLLRTFFCAMGVFIHFGGPFAAETIRLVYSSVNPHALLVSMAEKRGLYAKYGLSSTIVYVSGGSTAIQAMVSGDVDLAQLTGPPGVAANLRGADIVYFAMTDDRMGYQLVTRPEIKSANELKGKRFAISRFASSADFGARALLRRLGVDPKDVTILQIGNEADRLAALRSGSVDGSVFNAPFGALAKKFNFNILADAGVLGIPYFNTGICGSAKLLQKNEGKILNFLRAYVEAIRIFKTEPEYTLKALAQFSRVSDQELLKEAYEYNKTRIPDMPYPSLTAMQAVVDPLVAADPKAGKVDAKNFITDRFLKKLEEEGFVQKLAGR
ncbi:MAG: ABC transporter substrate-binding protein [Deltaproteobacteria bacterium]|nr:ABC transporter substrate-binding protein [Deltaproteobacteria bacterium]MBI2181743.1 ABC transporter substrate-binding protein [Deltaproteobacteria bacterium]MBI2367850.1 ABC transporter substrate-binding protein [Deltaproteobacteria bacterium]MBI3064892.1 ABC transporter substrate-binding protein [Deltaproteobacteria bacterium]